MNKKEAREVANAIASEILESELLRRREGAYDGLTVAELAEAKKIDRELDVIVARLLYKGRNAYEQE